MPVYTESRLERLQRLYRRTVHELASARRSDDRGRVAQLCALEERLDAEIRAEGGRSLRPVPTKRRRAPNDVDRRLRQLGVTTRDVRAWAIGAGLDREGRHGRISAALVEAYAAAQPTT